MIRAGVAISTEMTMNFPDFCPSVCFTGHRDLDSAEQDNAMCLLDARLRELIEKHGARSFYAGGALGFDTAAAFSVLALRRYYPAITLTLFIPCPGQDKFWSEPDRLAYRRIINDADRAILVSPAYFNGCMQLRDRALVDAADLCVAYLRPGTAAGGTAYTVRYAERRGVPVMNLRLMQSNPSDTTSDI